MTATENVTGFYTDFFKGWNVKALGPKPTEQMLEAAHSLGGRPGAKATFALAMYLRPDGATQAQVIQAVRGSPCVNVMRRVILRGTAFRKALPVTEGNHMRYAITLSAPKGKAKVKAAPKQPVKAGKPRAKRIVEQPQTPAE